MAICMATLDQGTRCTEQAAKSSNYCERHQSAFYGIRTQQQQQQHGISTQQQQQQHGQGGRERAESGINTQQQQQQQHGQGERDRQ